MLPAMFSAPHDIPQDKLQLALEKCRSAFHYAALFSLCINILTLLISLYSMQVLDRVLSSRNMNTLLMLTLVMVAVIVFQSMFSAIRSMLLDHTGAWMERTLGPDLLSRSIALSSTGKGASASQQQRDVSALRQFITGIGMVTLFDAPWTTLYLLVIFMISAPLGWLTLAGCLILAFLALLTEFATRSITKKAQHMQLKYFTLADNMAKQAETVQAMGMGPALLARWGKRFEEHQELQETISRRTASLQTLTKGLRTLLQVLITAVGAYLALHDQLTAGGMIAASILAARAFAPFDNAVAFWKQFVTTRDAWQRLRHSLAFNTPAQGEMILPEPKGALSVEQLSYQIAPKTPPLLHQVTFQLAAGDSLGVIGPSGAGKSTLVRLLTGIITPSYGHIRLDGNDISTWNRADIGPSIGYVPQQVDLFTGTIRENIARMQENADPEAVIDAARMASVHELIQILPMGYDTVWSSAEPCMSPGQKQRIALARAVYGNPRFVVLDEPNLNLDGDGEIALIATLQQLKLKRVTVIVVAHKPSIISCLDHILVLRSGVVEQFGTRDQIMQSYTRQQAKL